MLRGETPDCQLCPILEDDSFARASHAKTWLLLMCQRKNFELLMVPILRHTDCDGCIFVAAGFWVDFEYFAYMPWLFEGNPYEYVLRPLHCIFIPVRFWFYLANSSWVHQNPKLQRPHFIYAVFPIGYAFINAGVLLMRRYHWNQDTAHLHQPGAK